MKPFCLASVLATFMVLAAVPAAAQGGEGDDDPSFRDFQEDVRDVGDIEVTVTSKTVGVSWQGISVGPNVSAWLRDKVDGLDGTVPDGNVSEEEADNAEFLIKQFIKNEFDIYVHDERYTGHLLIDHANPKAVEVHPVVASGITGPVNGTEGISLSFVSTVAFATRDADVHTVKLDMGRYYFHAVNESKAQELVGDFSLTVKAAEGWSIDGSTIQPECAADNLYEESGALVFTVEDVNCFTERTGVLLGFSITGGDDGSAFTPGPGTPLLLVALLALSLMWRRRL